MKHEHLSFHREISLFGFRWSYNFPWQLGHSFRKWIYFRFDDWWAEGFIIHYIRICGVGIEWTTDDGRGL